MSEIADLSRNHQRTVRRLSRDKDVSTDKITGLVETIKNKFYEENPDATGIDWTIPTTTINGTVPAGRLLPLQNPRIVVDEIIGDERIMVSIATRLAGTRVGIHVHEYGGTTFVIGGKGRVTDSIEGFTNAIYPVDDYYYMPSNIPMAAANLSKKDVVLMDIFITPVGEPEITFIEPGYPPV